MGRTRRVLVGTAFKDRYANYIQHLLYIITEMAWGLRPKAD